jgi:hypothetical protein
LSLADAGARLAEQMEKHFWRWRRNAVGLRAADAVTAPISRYPVPALAELPDDIRARDPRGSERLGFVPNVFVTLAHRPDDSGRSSPITTR